MLSKTTTYAYTNGSSLASITYSDDTPTVYFSYDRLGRQISAIVAGVSTNLYSYDALTQALSAEIQNGVTITRTTDTLGRPAGLSLSGSPYAVEYTYDEYGRFNNVSSSASLASLAVQYSYLPNTDLLSGYTAGDFTRTVSYEPYRSLVTSVENKHSSTTISRYDYENDALGRRTAIARSGTAFGDTPVRDAYGYNHRSEVTSARRTLATAPSQEVRGFSYDYAYDPIGNRISSTEYDPDNTPLVSAYTANALNQYENRTIPGYAAVRGSATNTATVTVNGNPTWRLNDYFYGGDEADNSTAAIMKELQIIAAHSNHYAAATGHVFVAQTPEQYQYDDDGNLTQDGRFTYTWDAENRLIGITTRDDLSASVPRIKITHRYDHQSRRIATEHTMWNGIGWDSDESHTFTYDGWNVISEVRSLESEVLSTNLYIWGLDISDSLQGAGGIGGLLSATFNNTTALYTYDANGNVGQLIAPTTSDLLAHYEYDPFGKTIVTVGALSKANPFRLSTKHWDYITGLGYWGNRWYSPELGKWLSKDPIRENGGICLYAFCVNNSINVVDAIGYSDKMFCSSATKYFEKGYSSWNDPEWANFKDRANKMREMGCELSVGCENCDAEGYTKSTVPQKTSIIVCRKLCERRKWSEWLDVLRHEFSHAYDQCLNNGGFPCQTKDKQVNPGKICTEIRAYINGSTPPPPSKETVISSACNSYVHACYNPYQLDKPDLELVCKSIAEDIYDTCSSLDELAPIPVIFPLVPSP